MDVHTLQAARDRRSFPWLPVVVGCAAVFLVVVVAAGAGLWWLFSVPESGVKLGNEMDPYALAYLERHDLLAPGEEVRAYYDATMSMDGTEAAILTDRRLLYHKDGRTTALALSEVAEVRHRDEGWVGDVIEVVSRTGPTLKIEIAPLNGGETFLAVLQDLVDRSREGVAEETQPPPERVPEPESRLDSQPAPRPEPLG